MLLAQEPPFEWQGSGSVRSRTLGVGGAGVGRERRGIILEPGFVQGGRWEESRQGPGWAEGE